MTIVKDILKQMPAVKQPQRKFLETLFVTILALRGRVNCRNLSRYCDYTERTIARQFRSKFDWPAFHQRVISRAIKPGSILISAQDASFIPKSGKHTFGLGYFFNSCHGRAERGLEISTLALIDLTRRCACTLAVAQTPPAPKGTVGEKKKETMIDFYLKQLLKHRHRLPAEVKYHAVDGFFAKQKYIDEVVKLKLHPITKLRCDANCLFLYTGLHPRRRGPRRKYDGKVDWQDLRRFDDLGRMEGQAHLHLYTSVVWHKSLKRCLRVVVLVNRQNPAKPRYIILASTDLELDGQTIVEYYGARFQIEFLFRDGKQFTGLSDCQSRHNSALDFHFNASLATVNLARTTELLFDQSQEPQVFSMASWKQRQFNERLLKLFIEKLALDPTWVINHQSYDELRTYGAIAA
jgi:hypothetical protein